MYAPIIQIESHGVANKVLSTRFQSKLLIYGLHRIAIKIDAYVVVIDNQSHSVLDMSTREEKYLDG